MKSKVTHFTIKIIDNQRMIVLWMVTLHVLACCSIVIATQKYKKEIDAKQREILELREAKIKAQLDLLERGLNPLASDLPILRSIGSADPS